MSSIDISDGIIQGLTVRTACIPNKLYGQMTAGRLKNGCGKVSAFYMITVFIIKLLGKWL
ncbi:hypothetical protein l11_09190 [Neisseria weaveri LMG 5135]|nr:hypothetical protein l13_15880 [Neisseria weaveri ATCC 51223]EGV37678.1 hypothetical protein l11_09190 [Neisseria weaveri LMG 5135]